MTDSPIYRYEDRKPNVTFEVATAPPGWHDALVAHYDKYLGKCDWVFHELISTNIHIDLYFFKPTRTRPFVTVVTTGISDAPLNTPKGAEEYRHIELMLHLPPDWRLDFQKLPEPQCEQAYWPFRLLKTLARFAHAYRTFFAPGHTIPNGGEAPKPYAPGVTQNCALLLPATLPAGFDPLNVQGKTVRFLQVFTLTQRETDYKMEHGLQALLDKMSERGTLNQRIDPARPCTFSGGDSGGLAASDVSDPARLAAALKETRQKLPASPQKSSMAYGLVGLALLIVGIALPFLKLTQSSTRPSAPAVTPRPAPSGSAAPPTSFFNWVALGTPSDQRMDAFLEARAKMLSSNPYYIADPPGFHFEDALTQSLERKEKLAPARFVFFALLKFARRMDPDYTARGHNLSLPLNALGTSTISKDSPMGSAFLAMLEQTDQDPKSFGERLDYAPADLYRWWKKYGSNYTALDQWLKQDWTAQYVLPKLLESEKQK